jgi:hypothetical protein
MHEKINNLIAHAQKIMSASPDPVHEISHVKRVVNYVEIIQRDFSLSKKQKDAIFLATWWHDVGRTITKKPSLVWMPFFDDIISALILFKIALLNGLLNSVAGLAIRIILCKSFGAGALFTKILLSKKNRVLLNIVDDADTLDMLTPERNQKIQNLVENSSLYHYGYKAMVWWLLHTSQLKVKTRAAKEYLKYLLQKFISWLRQTEIYAWHVAEFGLAWVQKNIILTERLLFNLSCVG